MQLKECKRHLERKSMTENVMPGPPSAASMVRPYQLSMFWASVKGPPPRDPDSDVGTIGQKHFRSYFATLDNSLYAFVMR